MKAVVGQRVDGLVGLFCVAREEQRERYNGSFLWFFCVFICMDVGLYRTGERINGEMLLKEDC